MDSNRSRISSSLYNTLGKSEQLHTGNFYSRFSRYFDYLLDTEHSPESSSDFSAWYVSNSKIEEQLLEIIDSNRDKITALTGLRGVGKSTYIRKLFGNSQNCRIQDGRLIIPYFFDNTRLEPNEVSTRTAMQARSAAQVCYEHYGQEIEPIELGKFIRKHKREILEFLDEPLGAELGSLVEKLKLVNPYGYHAEIVKYVANKTDITKIVIVVDDIEPLSYEAQHAAVMSGLLLRKCLRNTGRSVKNFTVDLIFSCRPGTYQTIRKDVQVDGYRIQNRVQIRNPVSLNDILKKRFDHAIEKLGTEYLSNQGEEVKRTKDIKNWNESYRILLQVSERVSDKAGNLITGLCNHDLRKTLSSLVISMKNSRWFETPEWENVPGAFQVQDDEKFYRINETNIMRSICCQEHQYIVREDEEIIVPNLLYNFDHPEADLMLTYVIRYLFKKSRNSWIVYGNQERIQSSLEAIFSKQVIDEHFEEIIEYMINEELLRYEKFFGRNDTLEIRIIPQPKLFSSWKELSKSTVIHEVMRDETWLLHRNLNSYNRGNLCGTSQLSAFENFQAAIELVGEFADTESAYQLSVRRSGNRSAFLRLFDPIVVSRRLFRGIQKSLNRYYRDQITDTVSIPVALSESMRKLANRLPSRL